MDGKEISVAAEPLVKYGVTESGRRVVTCHCAGGPVHEHQPNGGGMRIFTCPFEPYYPDTRGSAAAQKQQFSPSGEETSG